MRLVLGPPGRPAAEPVVDDFLQYARDRQVELSKLRVVRAGKRVAFAALPMVGPGGFCMILLPPDLGHGVQAAAARRALDEVLEGVGADGVKMAQSLVSPHSRALRNVLGDCGFEELATLVYLQRRARALHRGYVMPAGYRLEHYTPSRDGLFTRALERSYVDSLDCPALAGLRTVEEAMETHRRAGEHRPEWWHVLMRAGALGNDPVGVLLLSGIGRDAAGGIELVYLGLAPEARGRGLGDFLMQVALCEASMTRGGTLTLAADEQNVKALCLYRRHGLVRVHRRVAMLRQLRMGMGFGASAVGRTWSEPAREAMFPTVCSQSAAHRAKGVDQNCFERAKPCGSDVKARVS